MKDYYKILSVDPSASAETIKLAYRNLAKHYHPDKNPGRKDIEERFKEISEAYNVLSNPEKRRKYDLKRAYRSNFSRQESSTDNRKRGRRAGPPPFQFKRKKTEAELRKERITSYMFVGALFFFLALMIVMIVVTPYDTMDDKALAQMILDATKNGPDFKDGPSIYSADSPYDTHFGDAWIIEDNYNSVIVVNTKEAETVVCLTEANPPYRTIRNEYLGAGERYRICGIPNGTYYIKAYFGREWDPKKRMIKTNVRGGFLEEEGYFKSDAMENLIRITQKNAGENLAYSTYEVYLANLYGQESRRISEEEFFK